MSPTSPTKPHFTFGDAPSRSRLAESISTSSSEPSVFRFGNAQTTSQTSFTFTAQQGPTFSSSTFSPPPKNPSANQHGHLSSNDGQDPSQPHPRSNDGERQAESSELCAECSGIDFGKSFSRAFNLYEGARRGKNARKLRTYKSEDGPPYLAHFYYVADLGGRLANAAVACTLCNFLRTTVPDPNQGPFKLLAFCSSESHLFRPLRIKYDPRIDTQPWDRVEHNVFLAVVPIVHMIPKTGIPLRWIETELPRTGAIYRLGRDEISVRRLVQPCTVPPHPNLARVRRWLGECDRAHEACRLEKNKHVLLRGFRLINCHESPPVVEPQDWSVPYAALSYVWGSSSTDEWPRTILDAVKVTKRLGVQYLWVDRLCIDQRDVEEKQRLISRMDAIYEAAEFTIVAAAGDATTGLPGITTARIPQPRVELRQPRTAAGRASSRSAQDHDSCLELLGVTTTEYEQAVDREWLDSYRFGLNSESMNLIMQDSLEHRKLETEYGVSTDDLRSYRHLAEMFGRSLGDLMPEMAAAASRAGKPLNELMNGIFDDVAVRMGVSTQDIRENLKLQQPLVTGHARPEIPLPEDMVRGRTVLISSMEDPRVTIRNSRWATRGWTYQEAVLSRRRIVFTEQQVYWECRSSACHESLMVKFLLHPSKTRMADYMLSGIFHGDMHRLPLPQYGFEPPESEDAREQALRLNNHIRAYTSRDLTSDSDALNAFMGVAAKYSFVRGLNLLLGMPIWNGPFADGTPGAQLSFALSITSWFHAGRRLSEDVSIYAADVQRREPFPSWSWAGWKGQVGFSSDYTIARQEEDDELDPNSLGDSTHVDFFRAMTDAKWQGGIDGLSSPRMSLRSTDGSVVLVLADDAIAVRETLAPNKTWQLVIHRPQVLRRLRLYNYRGKTFISKFSVEIHLSLPMTDKDLALGHRRGDLITVLVFVSRVPFVWTGTIRFLILQKADDSRTTWTTIGRAAMTIQEHDFDDEDSRAVLLHSLRLETSEQDLVIL